MHLCGQMLLQTLRSPHGADLPQSALALGESYMHQAQLRDVTLPGVSRAVG